MILKELVRITILISLIIHSNCVGEPPVETIKQWNLVTYDFPHDWPVNNKQFYNAEQIVTTGFEIGDDRIFIATPRLFSGVPATISSVSRDAIGDSPVLKVSTETQMEIMNTTISISGVSQLVASHSRPQPVQLQRTRSRISLQIENRLVQPPVGVGCRRIEISRRLRNYVPTQNPRLRSEYRSGREKVCV